METVTINDERFQQLLAQLVDKLGLDAKVVVADEGRLFLKQAIGLTPPKTKAQGEQAIRDDLARVFTPANESFLIYEFSSRDKSNVDQWFNNSKGQNVHVQWDGLDIHGSGMRIYHQQQRNARGRTVGRGSKGNKIGELWKAKYVTSYDAFNTYLKKIQARVGMRKAGWLRAYYEIGGKLPQWIERHARRGLGRVQNNLDVPNHPSIIMASHAPGVMDDERILKDTFRARSEAIKKRIKLIVSGYAADVKAGIKIRNHAKRSAD